MPNLIVYNPTNDSIRLFMEDAIIKGKTISHVNGVVVMEILNSTKYDYMWTDGVATPISNEVGGVSGYEESASDFTPSAEEGLVFSTHNDRQLYKNAITKLKEIADFDFTQVETYIENNVTDMASAKEYLKKLSKAVLGLIKVLEYRG